MEQAALYGYRPDNSNPCRRIHRYRLKARERFLNEAEMARLGELLKRHEKTRLARVAMIRLLMLTGCRNGEIMGLRWSEVGLIGSTLPIARLGYGRFGSMNRRRRLSYHSRGAAVCKRVGGVVLMMLDATAGYGKGLDDLD